MNSPDILKQNIDVLKTRMGACFPGDRAVFRGHDLHRTFKNIDWVELYILGITGRRFSAAQLRLLHAMWVYTSYPDARIWNNRVAALAGAARSTGNLGMSAALAVSEASIYGRGIDIRAIDFLIRTRTALDNGADLADCVKKELEAFRSIAGYGRPMTSIDERIPPMIELAQSLDLYNGVHVRLAYTVEKCLADGRWRLKMNGAALWAGLAADMGLSPREYYQFVFPSFLAGMQPCFIEASERPEGTLLPLTCSHIRYEGQAKRSWPGADK
jgi:hypothetical protein